MVFSKRFLQNDCDTPLHPSHRIGWAGVLSVVHKASRTGLLAGVVSALLMNGCSSHAPRSSDRLVLDHGANTSQYSSGRCGSLYRVVAGDTLSEIAARCNVNMQQLAHRNRLEPPYFLRVGQRLALSGAVSVSNRPAQASAAKPVPADWRWPMPVTLPYAFVRDTSGLYGLEIYGLPGQEIHAVEGGEVVYAGNGITLFGWLVMIKHPSGYISTYAHNSRVLVKEGQQVNRGTPIALLGASGATSQPKLYLEARYRGRKYNVKELLKAP